jgi:hypothetical protein
MLVNDTPAPLSRARAAKSGTKAACPVEASISETPSVLLPSTWYPHFAICFIGQQ